MAENKTAPIGVKVISVLILIFGLSLIYGGASLILFYSPAILEFILYGGILSISALFQLVFGILLVVSGIFMFRLKNWARVLSSILLVVYAVVSTTTSIISYFTVMNKLQNLDGGVAFTSAIGFNSGIFSGIVIPIIYFIIELGIFAYLIFNKKVKEAFS